ncbi:C4-dicarboxylate TRAP transporter large permease protein DctM [Defluviimonas aquaemixtae]|uniref:C4-dicarboxylate TRAP transporter large permease protein DctM n=1 Tax=Albidovulum aquaemixtae TaxID=1542388 RepID=A0A2R8B696_9RHOB|nr:TRAP transporter large permease subunit [Defluviimonas aquaemixtae]SPH18076.1 C4-dicarboxylate TRAP transporter large permease protein DctM [Defluviimonas aquaemixtae]
MFLGLDGVEVGLVIVFLCLFAGILSGFPVAFALGGAGIIAFGIIAALDSSGLLVHEFVDHASEGYRALLAQGISEIEISKFSYPELPRSVEPLFPGGWELALDRNLGFIVNRMNERVFAGQSIETLLAVLMFVMMGITLERSKIANELLTTMARVFGPLPGGLAVSVVVVGAFLAASTGIVGATVVTMGLLSLPTMLRNHYSPELATGVIAASGTLGQIIPPSIVIVLLGTLAGDLYAAGQEIRASAAGCSDALTYLGEAAVLSVGTLFQAALLPGIMLAGLYALYAFSYALYSPKNAPPVSLEPVGGEIVTRFDALRWFVLAPVALIGGALLAGQIGLVGTQDLTVDSFTDAGQTAALRTRVSEQCKTSMIELHGQEAWDNAVAEQSAIDEAGGVARSSRRTAEELETARAAKISDAAPIGTGVTVLFILAALVLTTARGVSPTADVRPLIVGAIGVAAGLLADAILVPPTMSPGQSFLFLAIPFALTIYGCAAAAGSMSHNDLIRVVFPPLVLIIAVLGSILGGITNPTPAAALGAGGALLLAAYRRLHDQNRTGAFILATAFAVVIMILVGINFDLRLGRAVVPTEDLIAFYVARISYFFAIIGLLYACWVLLRGRILGPVVRETAKVTSMVFTILIGSQILNLVLISFGGEHYIQSFLRSFEEEWTAFLIVMLVLFILGFVLDFLEIIYIVVPIVGPVIYGGTYDPSWVTIMITVNLQTSFLTPPFGFALFYLRGVAPASVTTGQIYRGIIPFVLIQVIGLALLWAFPSIVTIVPALLPNN